MYTPAIHKIAFVIPEICLNNRKQKKKKEIPSKQTTKQKYEKIFLEIRKTNKPKKKTYSFPFLEGEFNRCIM